MGTSYYKLDIENREVVGKKATKTLRRSGQVPSVLYFKGEEPLSLSVNNKALNKEELYVSFQWIPRLEGRA